MRIATDDAEKPKTIRARGKIRIRSITIRPRPPTPEQQAAMARLARSLLARKPSSGST